MIVRTFHLHVPISSQDIPNQDFFVFKLHTPTFLKIWVQLALHKMHFLFFFRRHCLFFLEKDGDCLDSELYRVSFSLLVGAGRMLLVSLYYKLTAFDLF